MNLIKKISNKLGLIITAITLFSIKCNVCFATAIGTAEVNTATENIKRAITSIAMPLGRSINFCKCYNCSN